MATGRIVPSEAALALELIRGLSSITDIDEFGPALLRGLANVVPFDHGVFNDVDPVTKRAHYDVHPANGSIPDWDFDTFDRYLPQNPIFGHVQRTRDGSPRRLSDFLTAEQLHRLDLYTDVLQPIGIEYQVAFSLPAPRPHIIAVSLSRRSADFSDAEVQIVQLVRPHLVQSYRTVQILASHRAALDGILSALDSSGQHVVLVDDHGRVSVASESALRVIARHFGESADHLPPAVREWIDRERAAFDTADLTRLNEPFVTSNGGRRLMLRMVGSGSPTTIFVNEREEHDITSLRRLGLTAREADVLWHIAYGDSVSTIAARLEISPGTIRKHLEHVYRKLGVADRAAASALAVEAMHWHGGRT